MLLLLAGEEVVETDDIVPLSDETIAKMRSDKTRSASDENAL